MKKRKNWKPLAAFIVIMVITALCFTGCENDDPLQQADPITVTQNVTASFPSFSAGNTFNLTPTYTPNGGWGEHFSDADKAGIAYTINVTGPNNFNYTYNSGTGFTINNADNGGYPPFNTYIFTQTFKIGTIVIGSQVIKVATSLSGFSVLRNAEDIELNAIPSVSLTLSKQVQP